MNPLSAKDHLPKIESAASAAELDAIEQELFGRKNGVVTLAMQGLKDLDGDAKKEAAVELNKQKKELQEAIDAKHAALRNPSDDDLATADKIDVGLELPSKDRGHHHLVPEFIRHIEEVFGRMGFDIASGPEIESEEYNFDLLNIPRDHPARDGQDTFWIKRENADDRDVLRTHTSCMQIRYMRAHKPPFRALSPGKVYRKDSDATHSPMFHQFEGIVIDKNISLGDLKGTLITALKELISPDITFRWRTGYFPFVEPGMEMDVMWLGDVSDSREGKWLEMGGCGMVHPNVLRNCDIDPNEWQGFAFGFGVERPIMIKHQIPDLRSFYVGDPRFLRQF